MVQGQKGNLMSITAPESSPRPTPCYLVRGRFEATPKGPQVIFERLRVLGSHHLEMHPPKVILRVQEVTQNDDGQQTNISEHELLEGGWREDEAAALTFMEEQWLKALDQLTSGLTDCCRELNAIRNHGALPEHRIVPALQPIRGLLDKARGGRVWGIGAKIGPLCQIMIARSEPSPTPFVTLTIAPLKRPPDDSQAAPDYDFAATPVVSLRFMDHQGLDAMQAAVAQAREVFAKVSLESERILNTAVGRQILHLVSDKPAGPQ